MKGQQIKEEIKERYGKIALVGKSLECCCAPSECCGSGSENSPIQIAKNIGYDAKELEAVPESSILGVGCGAPVNFADIKEREVVVDIGSGGGIDVFLSANRDSGKVFGIDMTDEMLEKARNNAKQSGFTNVGFKKGDIERGIPIEDGAADVVISNCVINLTLDKVAAFREIYIILRSNGRMVISDLVTSKEVGLESVNSEDWCSCIDGALTKENYIESIRKAGFNNIETSQEKPYIERDGEKLRLVIKAIK
jgi:arsenite methyltransferase